MNAGPRSTFGFKSLKKPLMGLPRHKTYKMNESAQTELVMNNLNLCFAPVNMFSSRLRIVSLAGNKITELPQEIVKITSMQVLNLDKNQISEMPEDLW